MNEVSTDAGNSIYLWVGGLAFFGLFWAGLHFDVSKGIPSTLFWPLLGIAVVVNLVKSMWYFWKVRASNPDNPNNN